MKNKLVLILTLIVAICFSLAFFTACDDTSKESAPTDGLHYQRISGKNEYRVIGLGNSSELEIVIDSEYNGMPVTEVDAMAFHGSKDGCANIESVVIPDSVVTLGKEAFEDCKNLKKVVLSKYLTKIDESTFKNCSMLSDIEIPSKVTEICKSAFENCDSLVKIAIPDSVERIGESAFSSCDKLSEVSIGKKVNFIGDRAFFYCKSMTAFTVSQDNLDFVSLDGVLYTKGYKKLVQYALGKDDHTFRVPEGVTVIGTRAFYRANKLYLIDLPNTVSIIEDGAMSYCENLQSVTLSKDLTKVGNGVFSSSEHLTDVYYKGTPLTWGKFSYGYDWETFMIKVTLYYYSAGIPQFTGNFWYYDQGYPAVWR